MAIIAMRYLLLIRFILAASALVCCCLAIIGHLVSYNVLLSYIVQHSGKPHLLPLLRDRFFTPQKFVVAKYALSAVVLLYSLTIAYIWNKIPLWANYTQIISNNFYQYAKWWSYSYRFIPPYLKYVLGVASLLALVKGIYYIQFPIQYDEAWTYNYFIDNSLFLSLGAYNNHPLFTLMGHLFKYFPFDMHINLRLPVFLMGWGCILLLFAQLRQWFGVEAAVVGMVFFMFCCPITFYMLYARGYIFTVFFSQLLLLHYFSPFPLVERPISNDKHKKENDSEQKILSDTLNPPLSAMITNNLGGILTIALGLYSMPTFIYCLLPFVMREIWEWGSTINKFRQTKKADNNNNNHQHSKIIPNKGINDRNDGNADKKNDTDIATDTDADTNTDTDIKFSLITPSVFANSLTILLGIALAGLFYLPMILGTGIHLGLEVASDALSFAEIGSRYERYILLVWYFITGTVIHYFYIIILIILIVWAIRGLPKVQQKQVTRFSAFVLCLPILVLCLQRVLIPERIWTFLAIYMAIIVTAIAYRTLAFIPTRQYRYIVITILSIVAITGQSWLTYRHDFVNWSYQRDQDCHHIAQLMLQNSVNNYYTSFDYCKPAIEYYYRLSNKHINAFSADPNSASYATLASDTANYACIISDKKNEKELMYLSISYHQIFENDEIRVYFRHKNDNSNNDCP